MEYDAEPTTVELQAFAKIDALVEELMAMGMSESDVGHALCSSGLARFAGSLCTSHLLKELLYVRGFIDLKVEETQQEMVLN